MKSEEKLWEFKGKLYGMEESIWGCTEEGIEFPRNYKYCPFCGRKLNNGVGAA